MDPNDGVALTQAKQQAMTATTDLARLGLSAQAAAILEQVANSVTYDAIKADTDHTDEWKRVAYAKQYTSLMNTLARRLSSAATAAGGQDADDAANVLGTKGLSGDNASLAISRRDTGDRVADLNDAVTLQRLLAQATRIGDEPLARAIAEKALSLGDADTLNAFTADRPSLAPAVQRLWTAQTRKSTTLDFKVQMWLAALKPEPISSLQDFEVERLASGEANVGSRNVRS
jgi:hypothetical protein